jgi:hypothetical protein
VTHRVATGTLVMLTLLAAACSGAADPSARYFPTKAVTANPPASVDAIGPGPVVGSVIARGPISRPDPQLTPGVVAIHDLNALCQQARHPRAAISPAEQLAVFAAYKISDKQSHKYTLDYLVPLQLGGAPVQANIWPMLNRGFGFHEKASLNARLRIAVCRGDVPLDLVQKQIAQDWFSLWIKYGV